LFPEKSVNYTIEPYNLKGHRHLPMVVYSCSVGRQGLCLSITLSCWYYKINERKVWRYQRGRQKP